jgi:hypothetical protein
MVRHQFEAGMTLGDAFANLRIDDQHGDAPRLLVGIGRAAGKVKPAIALVRRKDFTWRPRISLPWERPPGPLAFPEIQRTSVIAHVFLALGGLPFRRFGDVAKKTQLKGVRRGHSLLSTA